MMPNTTELSDEEYQARHYRAIRIAAYAVGAGLLWLIVFHGSAIGLLGLLPAFAGSIVLFVKAASAVMNWITDWL